MTELTSKQIRKLWISRVFGILLSSALLCFLILFYLKIIDANMLLLGIFSASAFIFVLSARFMAIKSNYFWTCFSYALGLICLIAFVVFFTFLVSTNTITF